MIQFLRGWSLEAVHLRALRVQPRHDMLDQAVLAGRVHGLQDDQQRALILRVQLILVLPQVRNTLLQLALGILLRDVLAGIARVVVFLQRYLRAGPDDERPDEIFVLHGFLPCRRLSKAPMLLHRGSSQLTSCVQPNPSPTNVGREVPPQPFPVPRSVDSTVPEAKTRSNARYSGVANWPSNASSNSTTLRSRCSPAVCVSGITAASPSALATTSSFMTCHPPLDRPASVATCCWHWPPPLGPYQCVYITGTAWLRAVTWSPVLTCELFLVAGAGSGRRACALYSTTEGASRNALTGDKRKGRMHNKSPP